MTCKAWNHRVCAEAGCTPALTKRSLSVILRASTPFAGRDTGHHWHRLYPKTSLRGRTVLRVYSLNPGEPHARFFAAAIALLAACYWYEPPPGPEPRDATRVNASMGETRDAYLLPETFRFGRLNAPPASSPQKVSGPNPRMRRSGRTVASMGGITSTPLWAYSLPVT